MELRLQSEGVLDWLALFVDNEKRQCDVGNVFDCMKTYMHALTENAMARSRNAPLVNI